MIFMDIYILSIDFTAWSLCNNFCSAVTMINLYSIFEKWFAQHHITRTTVDKRLMKLMEAMTMHQ